MSCFEHAPAATQTVFEGPDDMLALVGFCEESGRKLAAVRTRGGAGMGAAIAAVEAIAYHDESGYAAVLNDTPPAELFASCIELALLVFATVASPNRSSQPRNDLTPTDTGPTGATPDSPGPTGATPDSPGPTGPVRADGSAGGRPGVSWFFLPAARIFASTVVEHYVLDVPVVGPGARHVGSYAELSPTEPILFAGDLIRHLAYEARSNLVVTHLVGGDAAVRFALACVTALQRTRGVSIPEQLAEYRRSLRSCLAAASGQQAS